MNIRPVFGALVALLLLVGPACADRLPPQDTSAAAPGFSAFRQSLLEALAHRDAKFIMAHTSSDIMFSFGGEYGAAAFRRRMRVDDPKSPFWAELGRLVRLGGAYDARQGYVWFPYFYHTWPEKYDGLSYGVVTGARVALRSAPKASASTLATLDWDIVKILDRGGDWVKIQTSKKQAGWVRRDEIHSPGWRRAGFKRIGGEWKLAVYVEGD
jgi:hypothetical protein